ncbi:MAG: hypothetical protein KJO73_07975, partial [Croceitalea sp.]|nr:hypothetical protein [Croceitalea sp.]
MKKLLTSFILLTSTICLNAQMTGQVTANAVGGGGGNNAVVSYLLGDIKSGDDKRSFDEYGIQGSAYTSENFLPTKLYYKNEFQGNYFYRFNAYNEEIELKDVNFAEAPVRSLQRDKNISIRNNGKPMSFKTFIDKKGLTQNGYLTLLSDGKYSYYKRTDVKYTEGQKAQNSFVKAIPARFSQFIEYYLEVEGVNRIDEFELSNRKLLKLVPNDKKEGLK